MEILVNRAANILCSKPFFPENLAVYEVISKSMVEREREREAKNDSSIRCFRVAC
jgi:hypothetical protein